jgi:CHASE3 domain sensor protein
VVYKPSDEELEQMKNLNKAYDLIREGIKLIKENIPKKDAEVELEYFRMNKNFDKIIKRIKKLLEDEYINEEFKSIIMIEKTATKKNSRLKKKNGPEARKKVVRKRVTKKRANRGK